MYNVIIIIIIIIIIIAMPLYYSLQSIFVKYTLKMNSVIVI